MTIRLLGVNHRTAPIELRERLAIAPESLGEAALALLGTPGVSEGMIVSTCNRVELVTSYEQSAPDVMDFMHRYFALEADVLRPHLYEYEGGTRCGICSAWLRAWIRWCWVSHRSWDR